MTDQTRFAADRPAAGIFWMIVTGFCFIAVTALVKYLGSDVPAAQSAFLRYFLGLVFLIPMLPALRATRLSPRQWRIFGLRGVVHTLGVTLWFFSMTRISIAEVTALNYLNPVFVTLAAAVVLGETLALRRLLAVGAALIGALVILRPGFRELDIGHIAMLGTAALFCVSYLTAKIMSGEVPPAVVVGILSLSVTIGLAPLAWAVWVPVGWRELAILFGVALFATAGHYSMTLAFQAAPVAVTQPVTFLQLVWAALLGAVVFGEPLDGYVVAGGTIIVAAVSFIAWREAVLKRSVTPPSPATKL